MKDALHSEKKKKKGQFWDTTSLIYQYVHRCVSVFFKFTIQSHLYKSKLQWFKFEHFVVLHRDYLSVRDALTSLYAATLSMKNFRSGFMF